ncbi:DUF4215 domain-containing protein [Nannocystis pusilla]|uniref:DUF4215 domain-containing protein n=1 Tax=Nannocystis pusilla TaxID=889268 RepID=UPI003B7DDC0B
MRPRESRLLPAPRRRRLLYHPTGSTPATDSEAPQDTTSGSTSTSSAAECGNGQLDPGEACDDGNRTPDDGCEDNCSVSPSPLCGNGHIDPGEQCDDGNNIDGDGCQADCTEPPVCGDGVEDPGEPCDDGNANDDDACLAGCVPATCGDGELWVGNEQCDDGALNGAYGYCSDDCSGPGPSCGDSLRNGPEECDDGNLFDDDDCSNECLARGSSSPPRRPTPAISAASTAPTPSVPRPRNPSTFRRTFSGAHGSATRAPIQPPAGASIPSTPVITSCPPAPSSPTDGAS